MPDSALLQLTRLLQLLPALADGEEHDLSGVAKRLGVDRRTVLADLQTLADRFDDPGGFVEGVQIYIEPDRVSVRSSHFARPMRLTLPELCALELGLVLLGLERPPEDHPPLERARERLRAVIKKLPADWDPEQRRYARQGSDQELAHLRALQAAWRQREKVRISYRKADAEQSERRLVCPYSMAYASGRWYLIAHCEPSEGIRVFRLDRIGSVESVRERFSVPQSFTPGRYLTESRVFYAEHAAKLRVRYSPRIARWVAEREGRALDADGSLTVEHPLADSDWAVRHVLQYGPDAEILDPEEVRVEVRRRLAAMVEDAG